MSQQSQEFLSQETFNTLWDGLEAVTVGGNYTGIQERGLADFRADDNDGTYPNTIEFTSTNYQISSNVNLQPQDTISDLLQLDLPQNHIPVSVETATTSRSPSPSTGMHHNMASSLPSNTDYPGQYDFDIEFEVQSKETKSSNWTYSKDLKKLFVSLFKSCPIKYKTNNTPPPGSYIRVMPIYMKAEYMQEVVTRCINHANGKESNENPSVHPPTHLVRCEHKLAQYLTDNLARESVIVPYESPHAGSQWVTNLFQFMCYSSCAGGLNRRNVQIIFTLENPEMEVLGRRAVEVRICACPGRDRKCEEKGAGSPPVSSRKRPHKATFGTEITTVTSGKRKRIDDEVFTLQVRGRQNYDVLMKIRDSLELMSSMPKGSVEQFKDKQSKLYNQPSFTKVPSYSEAHQSSQGSKVPFTPSPKTMNGPQAIPSSQSFSVGNLDDTRPCSQSSDGKARNSPLSLSPSHSRENSISDFLSGIGMMAYIDKFHENGFQHMHQLDGVSVQAIDKMSIGTGHRNKIWKAILEWQQQSSSTNSTQEYGGSNSTRSTISTGSMSQPGYYEIHRYTLKHTISLPKQEHDYCFKNE